ncbi:sugar transporter [Pisolithus croceorrhizus]|nr:sugar transporter [Pisolithus croceorrhizus]
MEYQRLANIEIYPDVEEHAPALVDADPEPDWRREVEKELLRKLDLRVGFLVLGYIMNFVSHPWSEMDRNNIAAARLKGLEERSPPDRTGIQYLDQRPSSPSSLCGNWCSSCQKYVSQSTQKTIYIPLLLCLSVGDNIHKYRSVLPKVFVELSHLVSSSASPKQCTILGRSRYKRDELGLRMAYFTGGSSLANAFGSLIASGVLAIMDGKLGYQAWRWLFFCEGGLTCMIAASAFYIIPDFPTTPAFWLTSEEQMLAQKRMEEELNGIDHHPIKAVEGSGLAEALTDWKVCHSDRTGDRFWHIAGPVSMGMIGFVMAISVDGYSFSLPVVYIVLLAWVSIAFGNTLSSISNIASSYVWPAAWGPSYANSFLICILTAAVSVFMLWMYRLHLIDLNKEAETNERALGLPTGFRYIT